MVDAIITGVEYGLLVSCMTGPIFFAIIQSGVEKGSLAALTLAAGQWFGDLLFILLAFYLRDNIYEFLENSPKQRLLVYYVGLSGGILLSIFGLSYIFTKGQGGVSKANKILSKDGLGYLFIQGFTINTINPSPLLFWLYLMGVATKKYNLEESYLHFGTILTVIIALDLLKVYLAKNLTVFLTPKKIILVRKVVGSIILGFGISILIKTLFTS